jgi:hypothetical protein
VSSRLAAVDDNRRALREATAVLAWFADDWLGVAGVTDPGETDEIVSEFLMDDCVRIPVRGGGYAWALNDAVRHQTLVELGETGVRSALAGSARRPDDPVQHALERLVSRRPVPPRAADAGVEEMAAELQVMRWLDGVMGDLPDAGDLQRRLSRSELLQPMRSLVAAGFFGRQDWLATIADHIADDGGRPFVISGVGGVGKSTLLAKCVLDAVEASDDVCFAYLNFDRGALEADRPARLLAEIVRQVALQAPGVADAAVRLVAALQEQERVDDQAGGLSSRVGASAIGGPAFDQLFDATVRLLGEACSGRLLLVLDTFEEVQRQQLANIHLLWELVGRLRSRLDVVRTIVSGRALDSGAEIGSGAVVRELTELDEQAAIALLTHQPGLEVSERLARRVIGLVSANPLSLRLAIDVLHRSDHSDALLDLSLQEGQIQGQLYSRILLHIDDPEVRKMAHPGLVVRVITIGVIRHVLAGPCEIPVADDAAAQRLYDALAREATLVTSDGVTLRHRSDVRALMLPGLERDQKPQVDAIHAAAVDYYASMRTTEARAEELYHRLMLGQTGAEVDARWDDAAYPSLRDSVDELPPSGRVYVWSRAQGDLRIDPEITRLADDEAWARATEQVALGEIRAGRAEEALEIVRGRRGADGESLLPGVEVEALEDLRRFEEALEVLDEARRSALRRRQADDAVQLSLDRLRVLERMGRFEQAADDARRLRESLRAGRGEAALDFLVASTSYLRLLRRGGREGSPEYDAAADEAAAVAERLEFRDLERRTGLVRELLAEIGTRSSKLLELGIETVGVTRGSSARLDEQLDRVERSLDDESESEVETRADTARKVTKYARQRGLDDELGDAISQAYKDETDGLYS